MNWYTELILFIFGLAFGSFLNVLTLRYSPERGLYSKENVNGRSRCRNCHKILSWYELIPLLSYVIQGGKCRSCHAHLSIQYPLVELASGLIFLFVPQIIGNSFVFVSVSFNALWIIFSSLWILALLLLVVVLVIDLRHYVIPNVLNLTLAVLGAVWIAVAYQVYALSSAYGGSFLRQYSAIFPTPSQFWANHILGAVIGGVFFLAPVLVSRGRAMGMGDAKLATALGLLFGWPDVAVIILLSFIVGALATTPLLILGKKKMSDKVPFGPFIVIAAFIVFFFGAGLMHLYFGIIGM